MLCYVRFLFVFLLREFRFFVFFPPPGNLKTDGEMPTLLTDCGI